jgi:hypothetical protein
VPYFDDAQSIIFLAPISAFDQHLSEVCFFLSLSLSLCSHY